MKLTSVALFLAGLVGVAAEAEISLKVSPADPHVNLADLNQNPGTSVKIEAKAPWTAADFVIQNDFDEPVEISGLKVTAVSVEGKTTVKVFPITGVSVGGKNSVALRNYVLESLQPSESLVYKITAEVQLKKGEANLTRSIEYKTR